MNEFEKWFEENLSGYSDKIAESGCVSGIIPYITLTKDCVNLFNQYEQDIWKLLIFSSQDYGYQNVLEMLIDFSRENMLVNINDFKTNLIWIICEQLARKTLAKRSFS